MEQEGNNLNRIPFISPPQEEFVQDVYIYPIRFLNGSTLCDAATATLEPNQCCELAPSAVPQSSLQPSTSQPLLPVRETGELTVKKIIMK